MTNNKLRIVFVSLMYIVFISLWAEGLEEQDIAKSIIEEQNAFIERHQVLTIEHDELLQKYDKLEYEHDSLVEIDRVKSEYVNGFGYNIDWNKAITLNKQQ